MAKPDHAHPDVDSALDLFMGDTPPPETVATTALARTAKEQGSADGIAPKNSQPGSTIKIKTQRRPKARTGRPPGARLNDRKLKDKTSLALDLELMDRYRKQSWKEECQLGELIERALREYAEQTWGWRFK